VTDECSDPIGGKNVVIAIGPNPPNPAVLAGTLDVQSDPASGTASFADLTLDYLGAGYTLVATVSGPGGTFSAASNPFDVTRVGDVCLGPDSPACAGTCADSDGDGLNDAWEIAGGIDLNGDGVIDAQHDLLLPGADPNVPDIYVHYDWMDYGTLDFECTADADCPQFGDSPFGTATCTGPKIVTSSLPHSCEQTCSADADCQSLGDAHGSDRCMTGVCRHTHDPELVSPGALDLVVSRFAAHGINLHIERGQALPHSHVISFRLLSDMTDGCEGGSLTSGNAGPGQYVESLYDLKAAHFDSKEHAAYHYIIFSHAEGCDTVTHCLNDSHTGACPTAGGCGTVAYGSSGHSEINGNDFIVSLGNTINDDEAFLTSQAPGGTPFGQLIVGGAFMHELGHNLGLHHGGGVSSTADPSMCVPPDCEDECTTPGEPNYKPNYLSVMNYRYQLNGIETAGTLGSPVPTATRLDYSTQVLPAAVVSDGVSGVLDEAGLDEMPAYGLMSGNADLFSYTDAKCGTHSVWPTHGPVDWDGDGIAGDKSSVVADLNPEVNPGAACGSPDEKHRGHVDWGPGPGQSIFRYGFQCTEYYADPVASGAQRAASTRFNVKAEIAKAISRSANGSEVRGGELTGDEARRAHVLYPTAAARMAIHPGCATPTKPIAPGEIGELTIALMSDERFDASSVDPASLRFHGAAALRTSLADIDGDGRSDLLVTVNMADVKLDSSATVAHLTGWLKSSQAFIGEDRVRIVQTMALEDRACVN
jgi:hypothetical protein